MAKSDKVVRHVREGFTGQRMVVLPSPVVKKALSGADLPINMLPSDIGYFPAARGHYVRRINGSEQCIIILCVRGSGWVKVRSRRYEVLPGNIAVIRPGEAHTYGADEKRPWSIHWCHAAGLGVKYFTDSLGQSDLLPLVDMPAYLQIVPLFEEILADLTLGYSTNRLMAASMALGHLWSIIATQGRPAGMDISSEDRVRRSVAYIQSQWRGKISIPEVARTCNLSTSHFTTLFKKTTGYAPLDYFLRVKIHRAAEIMNSTDRQLKQVAGDVGFADPLYFSRAFHRVYKMSPSDYRGIAKG